MPVQRLKPFFVNGARKMCFAFSFDFSVRFLFHCFPGFSLLIIELAVCMLAFFHHLLFNVDYSILKRLAKCLICFEDTFLLQFTLK